LELIIWVDNIWTARNQLNLSTKSHGKSFKMPHFVAKYVCSHCLTQVYQIRYVRRRRELRRWFSTHFKFFTTISR